MFPGFRAGAQKVRGKQQVNTFLCIFKKDEPSGREKMSESLPDNSLFRLFRDQNIFSSMIFRKFRRLFSGVLLTRPCLRKCLCRRREYFGYGGDIRAAVERVFWRRRVGRRGSTPYGYFLEGYIPDAGGGRKSVAVLKKSPLVLPPPRPNPPK